MGMKKKHSGKKQSERPKKKAKISKNEDIDVKPARGEIMTYQTLREGMLVLGCVIEIGTDHLLMSLPGCLVGKVPITNISRKYTEILKESIYSPEAETRLSSIVELGSTFPCKVVEILQRDGKKPIVSLSIDPQDVHADLRSSSLYPKMILHAAVQSLEDHGYAMDIGVKGAQGFMLFSAAGGGHKLCPGQLVTVSVRKLPSEKTGNAVWLSKWTDENFPEVGNAKVTLSSLLPGTMVAAYVTELKHPYIYMKCMRFDACANALSLGGVTNFPVDTKVLGTVLYAHPITNTLYLHLGKKPSPQTFWKFFKQRKYEIIKNVQYEFTSHNRLFFKVKEGVYGFSKLFQFKKAFRINPQSFKNNNVVPKSLILNHHYIDNLLELSFQTSLIENGVLKFEDVKVGDIYEGTVMCHNELGMFVNISLGLDGFVRREHLSDSMMTSPEKLYPIKSRVKCRVLSMNSKRLQLTTKQSLIKLPPEGILQSFDDADAGMVFKGVIVYRKNYALVAFFNNVKGLVQPSEIPTSSKFYVGQTVTCSVLRCDHTANKLHLSLMLEKISHHATAKATKGNQNVAKMQTQSDPKNLVPKISPAPEKKLQKDDKISSVPEKKLQKDEKKLQKDDKISSVPEKKLQKDEKKLQKDDQVVPKKSRKADRENVTGEMDPKKIHKAVIKSVTGHQLNVLLKGVGLGRVHVTQLGCSEEYTKPLKRFKPGEKLTVHAIGDYVKKNFNFLEITNRKFNMFLECSLVYPPPCPVRRTLVEGMEVMGIVKKISDDAAYIWLSPDQTGVLDFVHFSQCPKELRKLKKKLKMGTAVKVTVFEVDNNPDSPRVSLTKLAENPVRQGANVVGSVKSASLDEGLVLKLPCGYRGRVCLTDLQDRYREVEKFLEKCRLQRFLMCHVIEVNVSDKFCVLSLRKSRVYGVNVPGSDPEITSGTLVSGMTLRGIVRSVSSSDLLLDIGRMLDARMPYHRCEVIGCELCPFFRDLSASGVVTAKVESVQSGNGKTSVHLSPVGVAPSQDTRLSLAQDINWADL